ncbi:MAG TPA: hypothetical protein PKL46_02345 [Aquabacterium sp.]|nr:hypothetical protein [Aquabacterium sp.]
MPTIPLRFDPPAWEHHEGHFDFTEISGITVATWNLLGLSVRHPSGSMWADLSEVKSETPALNLLGYFGFNLGKYSEIFLGDIPNYATFRMGNVEVTFGQPSPLITYLFDGHRDKHFHGHWFDMATIRIYGSSFEEYEIILLSAFDRYEEKFSVLPHVVEISPVEWADVTEHDDDDQGEVTHQFPAAIPADVEPLRCMYYAKTSAEPAAACIQYFRVLEYYAFFSLSQRLNTLRRDSGISDREFFLSTAQLLTKDEKGPIIKLVAELATNELLSLAKDSGLVARIDSNLLGSNLYDFRNSIVHAKNDFRTAVMVDPIVSGPTTTNAWRRVLHQLAKSALQNHASQRFIGGA